jgi:hypothetical protein
MRRITDVRLIGVGMISNLSKQIQQFGDIHRDPRA